jgi:ankyrin repeat protein
MKNLMYHIKKALYLVVLIGFGAAHAGSFDDFFTAIKRDDPDTIKALLRRGFDANTPDLAGQTGLFLALREPSLKVAQVLIEWPKTTVESRNQKDESPLMIAAINGQLDICQKLITRGADVNKTGWTPLHYAASRGHTEVIKLLLENYAYIDAESPNKTTPLMMAASYSTPETVQLLLDEGADPTLRNQLGLTAIDFAQRAGKGDAAELIAGFMRKQRAAKGKW